MNAALSSSITKGLCVLLLAIFEGFIQQAVCQTEKLETEMRKTNIEAEELYSGIRGRRRGTINQFFGRCDPWNDELAKRFAKLGYVNNLEVIEIF